jgi:hypothetical protein
MDYVSPPNRGLMFWSQFSAIFDTFRQKKLAFFWKTNVMIKILLNLALFWVKNANLFADFFRRKYFKNHNIGPRLTRGRFLKKWVLE